MTRLNPKARILAVDDSPDALEVLNRVLVPLGYQVLAAPGVPEALRILEEASIDIVITDLKMPGASGLDLTRHIRENFKNTEVLMITGYPSVESAVMAVKAGAAHYLSKPFTNEEVVSAVQTTFEKLRARCAMQARPNVSPYTTVALMGECKAMRAVVRAVDKAVTNTVPILISGERGTRKDLIARAIHYSSPRGAAPFVMVSCDAIPCRHLETELFGSSPLEPTRRGLVHAVQGGTLFLEEVPSADTRVQKRLTSMLRDRSPTDAGHSGGCAEPRVIASSSLDLRELVVKGTFRDDLSFALGVVEIYVPPLRDRGDDVVLLARHFALKCSSEQGKPEPVFSDRALEVLRNHSWPGNLQELEQTINRLVAMNEGDAVDVPDLPELMRFSAKVERGLHRPLAEIEAKHIREVLASVEGNQTKAAEILGIDRKTLHEKMKRFN